ncbi:MAG: macro domain-containing protein [Pseudomonadales bacterium]
MLHFHRTSLMTSQAQTLVNTVNTVGVMGKGIAAEFKSRYPKMFEEYKLICEQGELKPGSIWLWKGDQTWVLNFATKKHWRSPSKIEWIQHGLMEFRRDYQKLGIREIAFPRLGCGNGGLDWADVRPLMVKHLQDLPIKVYIHDFERDVGAPEHELPLLRSVPPRSYECFKNDVRNLVKSRDGKFKAIFLNDPFSVDVDEAGDLRAGDGAGELLAAEEDLYRLWALLLEMPVSRLDLPDSAYEHALKLLSVLAELPYARPINLADRSGRNSLAIELFRQSDSEQVPRERIPISL